MDYQFLVAFVAFVACWLGSSAVDVNYTEEVDLSEYDSNYFFYDYSGLFIPFPLDLCIRVDLEAEIYATFVCNEDGTEVTFTNYTDDACASAETSVVYTSEQADFECNGDDNYGALDLGLLDCAISLGTMYAAVGVCFEVNDGTSSYYSAITCDEDSNVITVNQFADEECEEGASTTELDECTFFVNANNLDIYYESALCSLDLETTTTPSPTTVAASSHANKLSNTSMITLVLTGMLVFIASVVII